MCPPLVYPAISNLNLGDFTLDGNGTITPLELQILMRNVLGDGPSLEDQVQAIIESVDADGSGTIDFDEFLDLMSDPRFNDVAKDEHRQAFEMFDKDGNGNISLAELKEAFSSIGEPLPNPSSTRKSHRVTHVLFHRRKAERRGARRHPARGRSRREQTH